MKEIKIYSKKFGEFSVLIDDEDYDRLMRWTWHIVKWPRGIYARRHSDIDGVRKFVLMHREIFGVTDPNVFLDHKDRNGLNNQKSNLRIATRAENARNSRKRQDSASKYKGVCWSKADKKWKAVICYTAGRWKTKHLGIFILEEDAAHAYDRAARELFGEYASLNFPKEGEQSCVIAKESTS